MRTAGHASEQRRLTAAPQTLPILLPTYYTAALLRWRITLHLPSRHPTVLTLISFAAKRVFLLARILLAALLAMTTDISLRLCVHVGFMSLGMLW
jgi:hypothetical protein